MDANKVFVGNLSWDATEGDLRAAVAPYGTIVRLNIVVDRDTGRSKGFAFVEMSSPEEARAVINGLNGKELLGRSIRADHARPRAGK